MKSYIYLALTITAFLFLFPSCLQEHNALVPNLEGVPAGGVTYIQILDVEDDLAEIEVGVFVVDHFGSYITGIENDRFTVESNSSSVDYTIDKIDEEEQENLGAFSVGMDFDQSGSINDTDPFNARIFAGVSFADKVGSGDEAAVFAFSDGGFYTFPHERLVDFTDNVDALKEGVESMEGRADGGTPLYRSIFNLISYVSDNAKNDNKAIIVFTDGEDTEGGYSINQIIAEACAHDVRIFTVGLGNGVNDRILSEIAFETNGAVMLAEEAEQLIAQYSSLGQLLHGEAKIYRIRMSVRKNSGGSWFNGNLLSSVISLQLAEDYRIKFPIERYIVENPICN